MSPLNLLINFFPSIDYSWFGSMIDKVNVQSSCASGRESSVLYKHFSLSGETYNISILHVPKSSSSIINIKHLSCINSRSLSEWLRLNCGSLLTDIVHMLKVALGTFYRDLFTLKSTRSSAFSVGVNTSGAVFRSRIFSSWSGRIREFSDIMVLLSIFTYWSPQFKQVSICFCIEDRWISLRLRIGGFLVLFWVIY